MLDFLILDYNRPVESKLCLESIHRHTKFPFNITYLSNGGKQDYPIDFYKQGLIDKLILRKDNSGCGLGTRELFNDFNLDNDWVAYIQSDQYMIRDFEFKEFEEFKQKIIIDWNMYVDLAGNQGHGQYSERAHMMLKSDYRKIPNGIGGPGKYADYKWTEQCVQEYMKQYNLKFFTAPILFADNGKISIREYPCGGILILYTDTKQLFVVKRIEKRVDFPNLKLTDQEWDSILKGEWVNGTVPEQHKEHSFLVWEKPYGY